MVIKSSIFVVQFFNTAILLLLTNANTKLMGLTFIPLEGRYPDLTMEWYWDIGASIGLTMVINMCFPVIELCIALTIKTLLRLLDKNFRTFNKYVTKKKTIQQYVNLYAGPVYLMHFKYSSIMNVTFITFMYGLLIPMLFPIALLSFLILYTVEKLTLTYFYRKPPMYD